MPHPAGDKCFVVMPFGVKPMNDGSGRVYDFDKIHRIIMQRAIRQAGLIPMRADEQVGSHIIHTDMFRALRDHAVVLADLSLQNPNVFYELGIRHVMSPRGTVLMCRAGAELPFDVKLSRVIFYKYDGEALDWEEAERVVQHVQFALEEARRGVPDSPVHALLEKVLSEQAGRGPARAEQIEGQPQLSLDAYQRLVAAHWARDGPSLVDLLREHRTSVFGIRAVAYLCLSHEPLPEQATEVAKALYNLEQYDLTNRIYEKTEAGRALGVRELLSYGSALSEADGKLAGAERGLRFMNRALEMVLPGMQEGAVDDETLDLVTRCYQALSGLHVWKWELSRAPADLHGAIDILEKTREYLAQAVQRIPGFPIGRIAQVHLRLLLLERIRDENRERADVERHRDAILALKAGPEQHPSDVSYLRWYQAIALADAGDGDGSNRMAMVAFSEDAKIIGRPECSDIGRRQYTHLRRFIEHHSDVLRNPSLVGHISQVLQIGHRT